MGRQPSEGLPYSEQEGAMEISRAMENDAVAPTVTEWIGQASKELEKVVSKNVEVSQDLCSRETEVAIFEDQENPHQRTEQEDAGKYRLFDRSHSLSVRPGLHQT